MRTGGRTGDAGLARASVARVRGMGANLGVGCRVRIAGLEVAG
jgi:hypothetical protein